MCLGAHETEGGLGDELVLADMLEAAGGASGDGRGRIFRRWLGRWLAGREALARLGGRVLVDPERGRRSCEFGVGRVGLQSLAQWTARAHRVRRRRAGRAQRAGNRARSAWEVPSVARVLVQHRVPHVTAASLLSLCATTRLTTLLSLHSWPKTIP